MAVSYWLFTLELVYFLLFLLYFSEYHEQYPEGYFARYENYPFSIFHYKKMLRRNFVKSTLGLAGAAALATSGLSARPTAKNKFNLKYAPHFGMFKNLAG